MYNNLEIKPIWFISVEVLACVIIRAKYESHVHYVFTLKIIR